MSTIVEGADAAVEERVAEERVTDVIRGAIVRGEYAPNQRLIEADLSDAFGASRATVRTALLELANEGLVERLPNKGSRVRAISVDEAIEILEVRIGVEGLCAAKTAAQVSDDEVAEFLRLRQDMITPSRRATSWSMPGCTSCSTSACGCSATTPPPPPCSAGCTPRACATSSSSRPARSAPRSRCSSTRRSSTRSSPRSGCRAAAVRDHLLSVIGALRDVA